MLEAAKSILERFPGTTFVFAGRDTEKLRRKAAALGLSASVELLGERADVPELLAGLHLFVMPSIQQGLPYALIEAQAAGVPAVAAGVGGILDVLLDEETGLVVPPQDAGKLAQAVIRVLSDDALARRLAANGLERIQREFSIPVVTDRLEALYQAAVRL
jgi:glycosyltransferase involved in cell wall biosynthesis